jgi:predicted Zn-dependent protease
MLICIPIVGWIDSRVFGEANRARELEADRWGVALAVQAGFDRNAAPAIWRKLASSSSSFNVNGPVSQYALRDDLVADSGRMSTSHRIGSQLCNASLG